ncbi:MAG TPA: plastocyanin/azurin family copper-binding protein [Gemmatimonadales bacterium]|nr:plastocyanin/azurin family copper-binding protein [Gemmatimonadales bacterium]
MDNPIRSAIFNLGSVATGRKEEGGAMLVRCHVGLLLGAAALLVPGQLRGQGTHTVEVRADRAESRFGFHPLKVSARPGDVIVFRVVSGPPHSIAFDPAGLEGAQVAALNRAMVGRVSELRGPLLVNVGDTYRLVVPRLTAGTYRFYCLTHQVYGAVGSLVIE